MTLQLYNGDLLLVDGDLAVHEDCCCEEDVCTPYVHAAYVTNVDSPTWGLTNYWYAGEVSTGTHWRLIEVGVCHPDAYPWYGAGCVSASGELTGLPALFTSEFYYDGFMELQIGCVDPDDPDYINWPGTLCQVGTPVSEIPC